MPGTISITCRASLFYVDLDSVFQSEGQTVVFGDFADFFE